MAYLLDTSILARLANTVDMQHAVAARSVVELHRRNELLHITPQVLIEFRNVATRSTAVNGLGLSIRDAELQSAGFEEAFPLLPDTPDVFAAWKSIVESLAIIGKQVHDARLLAICRVHGISHLLTFNVTHFARLATLGPSTTVVHPSNV